MQNCNKTSKTATRQAKLQLDRQNCNETRKTATGQAKLQLFWERLGGGGGGGGGGEEEEEEEEEDEEEEEEERGQTWFYGSFPSFAGKLQKSGMFILELYDSRTRVVI
jgi:hypothetical protein